MKIKKILLCSLILSGTLFSCSKENLNDNNGIKKDASSITPKDLEFVGIQHNQLLQETYVALRDGSYESGQQLAFTEDFLKSKIGSLEYSSESNQLGIDFIDREYQETTTEFDNFYPWDDVAQSLTETEKAYLDDLHSIVYQSTDLSGALSGIEDLENSIQNDPSLDDAALIILYSATNTARYSLNYWSENYSNWAELGGDNPQVQFSIIGGIAGGDVAGAVGGAATAWVVNALPGAGQVAYGGAIIGGAVGNSARVAVMDVWNYLFD